jgi:hypothetical protein
MHTKWEAEEAEDITEAAVGIIQPVLVVAAGPMLRCALQCSIRKDFIPTKVM